MWSFLLDLAPKFADFMMTAPFLTRWYRFMKTQIGKAMRCSRKVKDIYSAEVYNTAVTQKKSGLPQ
jgi:hypothetical protein